MKSLTPAFCPIALLRLLGFIVLGVWVVPVVRAADDFFFRDGDRAMILGDSITERRQYSTLMESYVLSRFPKWTISFRNTGWGGDTMNLRTRKGLDAGFERDLKPLQPTAVTIDFGMNDGRYGLAASAGYAGSAQRLADKFFALRTRVAFITSSPEEKYEAGEPAGSAYNGVLRSYSDELKRVAKGKKLPFVDQLNPMIALIESGRAAGVLGSTLGGARLVPDAVHPNWDGSFVMAVYILKGLNGPSLVSSVEVNALNGAVKAEKAVVTEVKTTAGVVSFTRLDESMPWPVAGEIDTALKIPGFTPLDDLSVYRLKITGLKAGRHDVTIDGKVVGAYTHEQLAAGVNLSAQAGRVLPEVKALFDAIVLKNNLFFKRWREVQIVDVPDWISAEAVAEGRAKRLAELDAEIAKTETRINQLRIPPAHRWTIAPTS